MRAQILGKAEFLNPGGSIKDRVALAIVREAVAQGRLRRGGLITEGSAGAPLRCWLAALDGQRWGGVLACVITLRSQLAALA